ncbi:MAG: hypothetical protein GF353_02685 [Candidatus Lokiarchaeota archaeon]|nr:hypothetical protein [Candidatus Lokiarchaeota archaeon]
MRIKSITYSLISRLFLKIKNLFSPKIVHPMNKFSNKNYGIIRRLKNSEYEELIDNRESLIRKLIEIYGIQIKYPIKVNRTASKIKKIQEKLKINKIFYDESCFESYDGLKIPIYKIYPPNYHRDDIYPTIVLFSGHGPSKQIAFDEASYQNGAGIHLAKKGFLIYVMENRGMGKLSYLGNHLRIDAVARIIGGTWYGEIITDALWLIENLLRESDVDNNYLGVAGVSTGGALSMFTAALNDQIKAAYIQGYLGLFKKTFGIRANHCLCGHIPGILKVCEMSDIGALIAPRPALYVNGSADIFYQSDAKDAFKRIQSFYERQGALKSVEFKSPFGVKHEFSVQIASDWFSNLFHPSLKL